MIEGLVAVAFYLGVIAYSVASTLFFVELARPGRAVTAWAPRVLAAGSLVHALHVVAASLLSNVCPVESLHFALSVSALMATLAYLALFRRLRVQALGAVLAPLALAFLVGSQFVSSGDGASISVSRPLLVLHIAANVLGVGLFLLAGTAGAFYVLEERRLKRKRLGALSKLPALSALDKTMHRLLLAGFPLLTFGVVTGSLFVDRIGQMGTAALLRTLLGYASWLLLATVLVGRRLSGWGGRRSAYGTLAGIGGVLLVVLVYALRVSPE